MIFLKNKEKNFTTLNVYIDYQIYFDTRNVQKYIS